MKDLAWRLGILQTNTTDPTDTNAYLEVKKIENVFSDNGNN